MDKTHVIDWRHYREQDGGAGMLQSVPAKVDNAARWLEPQQSSRDTLRGEEWISCPQAALLCCQLGANQIILLQSDKKKQTHPADSPLGSEDLWTCCADAVVRSPEVFSVATNCLLPLSDSKNQP